MFLLLLRGDVSLNPGLLTFGVVTARFVRTKGPLLADMVASNDFDFLCLTGCLTETHICPFDSDSFLQSITPPYFPHKPHPSGIGGGLGFSLDPPTDPI